MSAAPPEDRCEHADLVCAHALNALPASEVSLVQAHLRVCTQCQQQRETLRQLVDSFSAWPTDVLRPAPALWDRLAQRIAEDAAQEPFVPSARPWSEPEWEEVAAGISCQLLATDFANDRVSMLVRLAPGVDYPPHSHAGVEELHLLDGELWIDDRKLYPGEFSFAVPGTADQRVWSETGCTCVLITSSRDVLR